VQNVFIAQMRQGKLAIMTSKRGYRETAANGDRFVVLLNGRRYDGAPGTPEYKVMDFERYAIRVETRDPQSEQSSTKAMSTWALVRDRTKGNLAEILWRIGLPLSALTLALLAIPLSFVNPRASRSVNLIFALLTYMVYSNLISIVQAWVSQGKMSFGTGWWIVHAAMMVVLLLMFYRRLRVGSLLSFLRLR
jgi:lipopolysaccharide export system permease protein